MSRIKAWKQLNHIKCDQSKDNESVISQSRSASNYQFSKVRFSKPKIDDGQGSAKNLGFASITKAKQRSRENSILNNSKRISRQNSLAELLERDQSHLKLKSPMGKKFQLGAKKLMIRVKKLYQQLKYIAQSLLVGFQKIKQQMEVNLIKVTDQLLKMGKDTKQVQKIHSIIHNQFLNIRKNIVILPASLTNLINQTDSQILIKKKTANQPPLTPLLNLGQKTTFVKPRSTISSIFNPRQNPQTTSKNIGRSNQKQESPQKNRPLTQRKKQNVSQFDKQPQATPQRNKSLGQKQYVNESTNGLAAIIDQMRQILNDSQ